MIAPATPRTRHPLALRLQCRKEWVEGQGTLSEIAGKHNVPPQTVVAWYRRENWTAALNRWLEKQRSDNEAPAKPPAYAPNTGNSTDDSRARKLQRLETQLEALDNFLDNAKAADEWHKLSTAKHRLLENFYILAGIAKPGSRRPGRERDERRQPLAPAYRPAPAQPAPSPIQPSAVTAKSPG
jgi:transposase-like protein